MKKLTKNVMKHYQSYCLICKKLILGVNGWKTKGISQCIVNRNETISRQNWRK